MSKYIRCSNCNKKQPSSHSNCCWINCECGKTICGGCGSTDIGNIPEDELDLSDTGDDQYWCCEECKSCGMQGCAMCV